MPGIWPWAARMVRINRLPLGLTDLEAIVPEQPDLILVSKVECAEQIEEVDGAIGRLLSDATENRTPWLMPILESARGIENAEELYSQLVGAYGDYT